MTRSDDVTNGFIGPVVSNREVSSLAAGTGLVLALLDVMLGYIQTPGLPWSTTSILSISCLGFFLAFLSLWYAVLRPAALRWRLQQPLLVLALAACCLGILLGVATLRWGDRQLSPELKLTLTFPTSFTASAVLYLYLSRHFARARLRCGHLLFACAIIVGTLALLIFFERPIAERNVARLAAIAACGLGIIAAWELLIRRRSFSGRALVWGLFCLVVAGPALTLARAEHRSRVPAAASQERHVRHVILILADTLRADFVLHDDQNSPPTPRLDALAQDSIVFRDARSPAPWTLPSVASILTGLSPLVHRSTRPDSLLPHSIPTLAERMAEAGYRTAAFGHNLFLHGMSRGFQDFDFFPKQALDAPLGGFLMSLLFPHEVAKELHAVDLNRLALRWIQRHQRDDFFLWLHYFDAHLPYQPPEAFAPRGDPPPGMTARWSDQPGVRSGHFRPNTAQRRWIRSLYAGEVRYLDDQLGQLIEHLKRLGIYDDALIVFSSDHGEEFWEHEGFEHGHTVYDEVIAVPLIIKLPGQHSSLDIHRLVSAQSITPTILSLCNILYDPASLSSPALLEGNGSLPLSGDEPLLSTGSLYYQNRSALIASGFKYIRPAWAGLEELYDLERDPDERTSLIVSEPERLEGMRRLDQQVQDAAAALRQRYGVEKDERTDLDGVAIEQLRALGYVQ